MSSISTFKTWVFVTVSEVEQVLEMLNLRKYVKKTFTKQLFAGFSNWGIIIDNTKSIQKQEKLKHLKHSVI